MQFIESIEIKYFRSIYSLYIKNIKDMNVFSGKNDAGKSNILKSLNLFFNNETDWKTPLDFYKDYNFKRLNEVRKDSIKGRQFISIRLTFIRGERCQNSLPEKFTIIRKWYRESKFPEETSDIDARLKRLGKTTQKDLTNARTSLTRFLNLIKYEYIPAIKDKDVFSSILSGLQDILYEISAKRQINLSSHLTNLNTEILSLVEDLNTDFENATGISSSISLPSNLIELHKALNINTGHGEDNQFLVPLDQRGDGIRVRYIPNILNYISSYSKSMYIWGFEEPENSLEFSLCIKMADEFLNIYTKNAQIFITSHSPAFFSIIDPRVLVERIAQEDFITIRFDAEKEDFINDFGLNDLYKEIYNKLRAEILKYNSINNKIRNLEQYAKQIQIPLVLTEGKTDKLILEAAWNKLYPSLMCPFKIESCDVMPEHDKSGGAAGYETLKQSLDVVRHSNQSIVFGIFDNDRAGNEKGYNKLSKNFIQGNSPYIKIHKNSKAVAILLPPPSGCEEFVRHQNLPIEFFFDEESLNKKINGKGLELKPKKITQQIDGLIIDERDSTELYQMKIEKSTKMYFAEKVVPTLSVEKFDNFNLIFKLILSYLVVNSLQCLYNNKINGLIHTISFKCCTLTAK